jgi:hypothetical protein
MGSTTTCAACGATVTVPEPLFVVRCSCGAAVRIDRRGTAGGDRRRSDAAASDLDLYAVLGVTPSASTEEIRAAHRRAARETHPDLGGDPERFHAVQLAWEVLGDERRRADYDRRRRFGATAGRPPFAGGPADLPPATVPDIIGLTPVEAARALAGSGLVPRPMITPAGDSHPLANRVVGQSPYPGSTLPVGSTVAMIVAVADIGSLWRSAAPRVRSGAESVARGASRTLGCASRIAGWALAVIVLTVVSVVIGVQRPLVALVVFPVGVALIALGVARGNRLQRRRWQDGRWW